MEQLIIYKKKIEKKKSMPKGAWGKKLFFEISHWGFGFGLTLFKYFLFLFLKNKK